MSTLPEPAWPPGAATGVGSLPGLDIDEALRLVLGELPDLPHLPELPARGVGADLIGRGATLLAGLPVDLQPAGWRLVDRPGVDGRRAADLLAADLDALELHALGYTGSLKLQVAGPLTLAASLELPRGDRALRDPGAVRDLADSLAEGVAAHVAEVTRRVPGARLLVQLDEPSLPAVLAGRLPTASGFGRVPAVEEPVAAERLGAVLGAVTAAGATPLVHCCAAGAPIALLVRAGARAVSLDAAALSLRDDDVLGSALESGVGLFLGSLPALGPGAPPSTREAAAPARGLWRRLGFPAERLAAQVVTTPACGLAGASPGWARTAMRLCRQAGKVLVEAPEEER